MASASDHSRAAGTASRRQVLRLSTLAGAGLGLMPWLASGRVAHSATGGLDYTDHRTFDAFYAAFAAQPSRIGQSTDLNETLGALAWGQSYIQLGLLRMYQAYGLRSYLDTLLSNIDDVLATRDSVRGVSDWRGRSRPAWRAGPSYTAGVVDLPDADGRPSLQVRSMRTPVDTVDSSDWSTTPNITVTVAEGTTPGTFKISLSHTVHNVTETFDNLSMDPASALYATKQFVDRWPTFMLCTVEDLRADRSAGGMPAYGTYHAPAAMAIFAVHTGMITNPIAQTARTIRRTPQLWHDPAMRERAERYVDACRQSVAVHDAEWRENSDGEGWYIFEPDDPTMWDGTELPANQFLALARAQLHLAATTGSRTYADRARKMARTLKNQFATGGDDTCSWHYWPSWGHVYQGWSKDASPSTYRLSYCCAQQVEDISHAHIDIDFVAHAAHDGVVFDDTDVRRLANTFTRRIATTGADGRPTVWSNVDGSGTAGSLSSELISAAWLPVAGDAREVFDDVVAVYDKTGIQPAQGTSGYIIFGVANIAAFARAGEIPL